MSSAPDFRKGVVAGFVTTDILSVIMLMNIVGGFLIVKAAGA